MIAFEKAYEIVMGHAVLTAVETVSLFEGLNRVLAQDVVSDVDMPPFDKSARDGYACRREDLSNPMEVIELISAGIWPEKKLAPGQCAKIMTGAPLPEGADCVIMIEHTKLIDAKTVSFTEEQTDENIFFKGEDIKIGDIVLSKGTRILPAHAGVMATLGCVKPQVAVRPQIGVFSTGAELVEPDTMPGLAQIRDSNSWQLVSQVRRMGLPVANYGIATDNKDAIDILFKRAVAENDIVIISGGVSVGDFDLVPDILRDNGINILFDRVAIKPGKPSTFGVGETIRVFGLPGNPVAAFVQFEILLKPFLLKMMGCEFQPTYVRATLDMPLERERAPRTSVIPVVFSGHDCVSPVDYHGSGHIAAMCVTDGFVMFPRGVKLMRRGDIVDVRLLQP